MKIISNSDLATILACLRDYVNTDDNGSLRAFNRRRLARLLLRKFERKLTNENNTTDSGRKQGRDD